MKRLDPTLTGHLKGDHLGARMLAARQHAGLKRNEAAKRIGLSAGQLGRIERGGVQVVSDPMTLVCAGRAYGVSDVWLYGGGAAPKRLIPDWYHAPAPKAPR